MSSQSEHPAPSRAPRCFPDNAVSAIVSGVVVFLIAQAVWMVLLSHMLAHPAPMPWEVPAMGAFLACGVAYLKWGAWPARGQTFRREGVRFNAVPRAHGLARTCCRIGREHVRGLLSPMPRIAPYARTGRRKRSRSICHMTEEWVLSPVSSWQALSRARSRKLRFAASCRARWKSALVLYPRYS